MSSGGRLHRGYAEAQRGRAGRKQRRRAGEDGSAARVRGEDGIRAMDPMPSRAAAHQSDQGADAAAAGAGFGAEYADVRGVAAVGQAGAAAAGQAFGGARAGAETAMHTAAAVLHGGLAALPAAAGASAAARGGEEVAGAVAVPQAAAAVGREAGAGGRFQGTFLRPPKRASRRRENPISSGGYFGSLALNGHVMFLRRYTNYTCSLDLVLGQSRSICNDFFAQYTEHHARSSQI